MQKTELEPKQDKKLGFEITSKFHCFFRTAVWIIEIMWLNTFANSRTTAYWCFVPFYIDLDPQRCVPWPTWSRLQKKRK